MSDALMNRVDTIIAGLIGRTYKNPENFPEAEAFVAEAVRKAFPGIYIVSADLPSPFYGSLFADALNERSKSLPSFLEVSILSHLNASSEEEAVHNIRDIWPQLYITLQRFSNRNVYWSETEHNFPFGLIGQDFILAEKREGNQTTEVKLISNSDVTRRPFIEYRDVHFQRMTANPLAHRLDI
ncbi:hypothetical protein J4405_05190 [Candidatus Woesearchaeota archaeon]|nr:hypothetical protein [Candidatus Woesearchaeota archaeon]